MTVLDLNTWIDAVKSDPIGQNDVTKIADVAAQILHKICEGKYVIPLRCWKICYPNCVNIIADTVFGELIYEETAAYSLETDGSYIPHYYTNENDTPSEEKDAVFVAGMILWKMLTGTELHQTIPQRIMNDGRVAPELPSRLDELLAHMTEANTSNRYSAEQALQWLSENFPSHAIAETIEKNTGLKIKEEKIELRGAETKYISACPTFKNRSYFVDKKHAFPYRACTITYKIQVSFEREKPTVTLPENCTGVGIDIGERYSTVIWYDSGKPKCRDIPSSRSITTEEDARAFAGKLLGECDTLPESCYVTCAPEKETLFAPVFGKHLYSSVRAGAAAFLLSSCIEKKVLFIDAGKASTRMCVAQQKEGNCLSFSTMSQCLGGDSVTEQIYSELKKYIRDHHNIRKLSRDDDDSLKRAAERLKCELVFTEGVTHSIELDLVTDGENRHFSIDQNNISTRSAEFANALTQTITRCCTTANVRVNEISAVAVAGRGAMLSQFSEVLYELFGEDRIHDLVFDRSIFARGTLLCGLENADEERIVAQDIGTLIADMSGRPIFHTIIKADDKFNDGRVSATYSRQFSRSNVKNDRLTLELFTRPSDKSNVQSTYDLGGGCIRHLGTVSIPVPDRYRFDKAMIDFTVSLDYGHNISADVTYRSSFRMKKITDVRVIREEK